DIVMGFGAPEGDDRVARFLGSAGRIGAMTFALPGGAGDYAVGEFSIDPFQHQEMIEILYHTLWETVHVFLEHDDIASDAGDAGFLYPFLGNAGRTQPDLLREVADSIRMKVADDARLREGVAAGESERIVDAATAIAA